MKVIRLKIQILLFKHIEWRRIITKALYSQFSRRNQYLIILFYQDLLEANNDFRKRFLSQFKYSRIFTIFSYYTVQKLCAAILKIGLCYFVAFLSAQFTAMILWNETYLSFMSVFYNVRSETKKLAFLGKNLLYQTVLHTYFQEESYHSNLNICSKKYSSVGISIALSHITIYKSQVLL